MIQWLKRLFFTVVSSSEISVKGPNAGQTYVEQRNREKRDRLVQALISTSRTFENGAAFQAELPRIDRVPITPVDRAMAVYTGFSRSGVMVLRGSIERYRVAESAQVKSAGGKKTLSFAQVAPSLSLVLRDPRASREWISTSTAKGDS